MSDVITGLRQVVQDLVAPDLKAVNAKADSLQKQLDVKFEALQKQSEMQHDLVMKTLEAFRAELRTEFLMLRANQQLEVIRQMAPLSERVAVLESRID